MKDSKLLDIANFISDLVILNILWIIFSLPVVTIFQSTTALFHSIRMLRKDMGDGILKEFLFGFRKHFLWQIANFLISGIFITIGYLDVKWLIQFNTTAMYVTAGILASVIIMFLITVSYAFLTVQYYDKTFLGVWKLSFILGIGHLPQTVLMALALAAVFMLTEFIPILFFVISISGTAYLIDIIFDRVIKKYIKKD